MNATTDKPFAVVIWGERKREWSRYATFAQAEQQATALRKIGMVAHVVTPDEEPEHRGERRRFLIWACMLGVVPPQRVVERIVAEIEAGP